MDPRDGARTVLLVGIAVGLDLLYGLATTTDRLLGVDYRVYELAGRAVLSGGDLYGVAPAGYPTYHYLYPPVVAPLFAPFAALPGLWLGFAAFTLVTVAVGAGVAELLAREIEAHGVALGLADRSLLVAFVVLGGYHAPSLFFAQVNLALAGLVAWGLVALADGRERAAGVAMAVPAVVKLFPAAFGLWLVRRRATRAIGAAVATGVGAHLLGLVAFGPGVVEGYVETALGELGRGSFAGGLPPGALYFTLRRPLSVLVPGAGGAVLALVPLLAVAPVVAYCYRDVSTPARRLTAVAATVVAVLVALPSFLVYTVYLLYPLVPLAYLLEGRARTPLLVGAALTTITYSPGAVLTALGGVLPPSALGAIRPVVVLASPPLVGCLLVLGACVLVHRGRGRLVGSTTDEAPTSDGHGPTGAE